MAAATTTAQKLSTRQMTAAGLATAFTCILGPLALPIPISPVPISLTNLAVNFIAYALGMKLGTISYLIYLLLGTAGLPVFSGYSGGLAKLTGPTGGYLIGFIFLALIAGYAIEHYPGNISLHILGMVFGTIISYLLGTLWLCYQLHLDFAAGLGIGVIPYLPGDGAKILIAVLVGPTIRRQLRNSFSLPD